MTRGENEKKTNKLEWISIKEKGDPCEGDYFRYFLIKIGNKPHVAMWRAPHWDSGWNIPSHWRDPTHYCYLPDDCVESQATMD